MRYLLMAWGLTGLAAGGIMLPIGNPYAGLVLQLGGIFLAIGMATSDVVEALKRSRRS